MWTSCFDVYSQSADSAKKCFDYFYPTENERINFILDNYDSILNVSKNFYFCFLNFHVLFCSIAYIVSSIRFQ